MSRTCARIATNWLALGLLAAGALAGAELFLRARHRRSAQSAGPDGLRPESAALEPDDLAGYARVVALGDSITHGMGLPSAQTYPALLAERLRSLLVGRPVTVVNAGICGQTAVQGLARLERDVLRFRPALTLISFGLNDASLSRSEQDAAREAAWLPAGPGAWLSRLHLYRTLRARLFRTLADHECTTNTRMAAAGADSTIRGPNAWSGGAPRVSPAAFRVALTEMVRRIRHETGGEVLLLTTHQPAGYNAIIRQVAGETGAGLADIERAFAGHDLAGEGLLECDGVHLTAEGQRLLADVVFRNLAKVLEPSQGFRARFPGGSWRWLS